MTNIAMIFAGDTITADDVRNIAPLSAFKGADEAVTSSTALQNDDALFIALAADTTYFFACFLDYEGGTQGSSDIQWEWSLPSLATMRYGRIGITTSGASTASFLSNETANPNAGTSGAGNSLSHIMIGTVTTGAATGNMQLQWAQKTNSGTATIVHAGSVLGAWEI